MFSLCSKVESKGVDVGVENGRDGKMPLMTVVFFFVDAFLTNNTSHPVFRQMKAFIVKQQQQEMYGLHASFSCYSLMLR